MKNDNSDEHDMFNGGSGISDRYASIFPLIRQLREAFQDWRNPRSQVEVTATPVSVNEIWSRRENHIPGLLSLLVHVSVVSALIAFSVITYVKPKFSIDTSLLTERFALSLPPSAHAGGGGGGGVRSQIPASKGVLPRADDKQFVPSTPVIKNLAPELMAEPTIISTQLTNLPKLSNLVQLGLPEGILGPPSGGKGRGGGIGDDGDGTGVGNLEGPGGPGCCGGTSGGGPPRIRANSPGVTAPSCPVQVEPNYSDEARRAKIQGSVVLAVTVEKDGSIEPNKVLQSLGYGLDEEAQKVLGKWKCVAAKYNGQPVALPIQIKVNFHLY
jgi:periplasmic protein TonB